MGTFTHHKITNRRASLLPGTDSVMPRPYDMASSVSLGGPENSCFLPLLLLFPLPGIASPFQLSSSRSSPPEASLSAPAPSAVPWVLSFKVILVLSVQPGSGQWDSMEGTLGLGVQSSALSLISDSSFCSYFWASVSLVVKWWAAFVPGQCEVMEGQIGSYRKRALKTIQLMQRFQTLSR